MESGSDVSLEKIYNSSKKDRTANRMFDAVVRSLLRDGMSRRFVAVFPQYKKAKRQGRCLFRLERVISFLR